MDVQLPPDAIVMPARIFSSSRAAEQFGLPGAIVAVNIDGDWCSLDDAKDRGWYLVGLRLFGSPEVAEPVRRAEAAMTRPDFERASAEDATEQP